MMLTHLRQRFIASRFKRRDLNIIENVSIALAMEIVDKYMEEGWALSREYDSASSLQFHGKCNIQRGQSTLAFEHNSQGLCSIVGPARIVRAIASQYDLVALLSPSA
jgi:hypothetical protein